MISQPAFYAVGYGNNPFPSFLGDSKCNQMISLQDHSLPHGSFSTHVDLFYRHISQYSLQPLHQNNATGFAPSSYINISSPGADSFIRAPSTPSTEDPRQFATRHRFVTPYSENVHHSVINSAVTAKPPGFTDFSISKLLELEQHCPPAEVSPKRVLLENSSSPSLWVHCSSSPDTASCYSEVSSCSCPTPPAITPRSGGPRVGSEGEFASQSRRINNGMEQVTVQCSFEDKLESDSHQITARNRRARKSRTVYEPEQVDALERLFQNCQYLMAAGRAELSRQLGLNENQIKIWFQNRRSKNHRDSLKRGGRKGSIVEKICH